MRHDAQFHYLIKTTYQPRVLGFGLAIAITLSQLIGQGDPFFSSQFLILLGALLLIYPHIVYWLCGEFFNSADGARYAMLIDGVVVGLLIVLNQFYLFAVVTFVSLLVMSTSVIARPTMLALNLLLLATITTVGVLFDVPARAGPAFVTDIICASAVLIYHGYVAYLCFGVTRQLGLARRSIKADQRELEGVAHNLRRYISPQLYASISNRSLNQKTSRKRLTVFFSDIEGFTQLMDTLEEEMITQMLNEYLNSMAEIAIKHGGTIDKFMGDGIMIFFGDPETKGGRQDALACCRMALEMRYRLRSLRKSWRDGGITTPLHIRIGIHTGYCAVGNFGSENRMDYTAVGGTVNIASRLEGKATRDGILISSATYQFVAEKIHCEEGRALSLKGIRQPVETYIVLGEKHNSDIADVDETIRGLRVILKADELDVAAARELLQESLDRVKRVEQQRNSARGVVRLLR